MESRSLLDTGAIYLPAMLIQIPVENAVKHGLCAIEGEKRLSVFVERDGKGIHIRIEDNGPGIVCLRMRDIRTVRGWERKSFYRTILLLNRRNKEKITYRSKARRRDGERNNRHVSLFRWILITLSRYRECTKVIRAVSSG